MQILPTSNNDSLSMIIIINSCFPIRVCMHPCISLSTQKYTMCVCTHVVYVCLESIT